MNDQTGRVLGRTLAVAEIVNVSGAKPTSPCSDNITAPALGDTHVAGTDCDRSTTESDSGTVIDATGPVLDPNS